MSLCPAPPAIAEDIEIALKPLSLGTALWRFHSRHYSGISFNPNLDRTGAPRKIDCAEGGARFSPFPDPRGKNVPTFYAGTTPKSAALESVFHELPHVPNPIYSRKKLSDFHMTHLLVARDLWVVDLIEPELRQVKVPGRDQSLHENEIIQSSPEAYPQTRAWARYFHRCIARAHGLAWRPRLGGEGTSYVFFGDRLSPTDFTSVGNETPIDRGDGLACIEQIAADAYIKLISS